MFPGMRSARSSYSSAEFAGARSARGWYSSAMFPGVRSARGSSSSAEFPGARSARGSSAEYPTYLTPMQKHLIELKAHTHDHDHLRATLTEAGADFRGTDHQIDRYFRVPEGRLKLRIGNIERSLIFYRRADQAEAKDSSVSLTRLAEEKEAISLADTLERALGTWVTVDKQREIYFIDNVKFHLDTVVGLGTFVEIEAIGESESEREALSRQVAHYRQLLGIRTEDLLADSYSDQVARRVHQNQ